MHEAGLVRDLMRKIGELAAAENAARVHDVRIHLGALCHMSADHLRGHFLEAARGTVAEGAVLHVEESGDIHDPDADGLVLRSIEVER
jgi:hydrogenase nickel incorporation protein HypA/HybF